MSPRSSGLTSPFGRQREDRVTAQTLKQGKAPLRSDDLADEFL